MNRASFFTGYSEIFVRKAQFPPEMEIGPMPALAITGWFQVEMRKSRRPRQCTRPDSAGTTTSVPDLKSATAQWKRHRHGVHRTCRQERPRRIQLPFLKPQGKRFQLPEAVAGKFVVVFTKEDKNIPRVWRMFGRKQK